MICKQSKVSDVGRTAIKKNHDDCRMLLTNFHLLLIGVTKTIITKVGEVVAFSVSLVSAVRAKLDSCYLQRQISLLNSSQQLNHFQTHFYSHRVELAPVVVSKRSESYKRRD